MYTERLEHTISLAETYLPQLLGNIAVDFAQLKLGLEQSAVLEHSTHELRKLAATVDGPLGYRLLLLKHMVSLVETNQDVAKWNRRLGIANQTLYNAIEGISHTDVAACYRIAAKDHWGHLITAGDGMFYCMLGKEAILCEIPQLVMWYCRRPDHWELRSLADASGGCLEVGASIVLRYPDYVANEPIVFDTLTEAVVYWKDRMHLNTTLTGENNEHIGDTK